MKKYIVDTVVLVRDGCRCALQGMVHFGPVEYFQRMQSELEQEVAKGAQFFFETTRGTWCSLDGFSRNEHQVAVFLRRMARFQRGCAKAAGYVHQSRVMKYPKNSTNADASFKEMVRCLCRRRLHETEFFVANMAFFLSAKQRRRGFDAVREHGPLRVSMTFKKRGRFILPPACLKEVMVHWRDGIAVEIIERCVQEQALRSSLVHYGQGHIPGMTKRLVEKGWSVQSHTQREAYA